VVWRPPGATRALKEGTRQKLLEISRENRDKMYVAGTWQGGNDGFAHACAWEQRSMVKADKADSKERAKILVVDDNVPNLELIQAYLEDLDCTTLTAHDGVEALDVVAKHKPDLILLDVMMPKMSGFEVCRRLKNNAKTSEIPVIMVTALNEFGDIERGIDCGTDDFVSKPVNKLELLTRVKTMLKLKHLSDELRRTVAYLSEIEKSAEAASGSVTETE
jgi:CheY-like chemotaxis protein